MSKASTAFRVLHPNTSSISSLVAYDATGAMLTPASYVDGTGDPAGNLSKVLTFATGSEPLFITPTFANPAAPVPVHLTRIEGLDLYKVLNESIFDGANPGRPTPAVTAAQEHLLYETLSNAANGGSIWTVKVPASPIAMVSATGKDPITGDTLEGNDILFRWSGKCPTLVEVEADVEHIADPLGFVPIELQNATT